MKYLSICSGIEAATVAWHRLGWSPIGFAEIEPFPAAVLAHHYPDVPNYGDMTNYEDWDIGANDVDLLVGGTPCQAFSVAGLRKGLEDHRGNLTLTFIDLADHFDPEWVVWENVPGVLSSKDNAFGCFLAGLCGASEPFTPDGRWAKSGVVSGPKRTAAWRILDAQYFGVAQRRRRVFVCAVRGSGNWAAAGALFPVGESVFWDSAPSREARKVAPIIPSRSTAGGGLGTDFDLDGGLIQPIARSEELTASVNVAGTIQYGGQGGRHDGVMQPVAFQSKASACNSMNPGEVVPTMDKGKSDGLAVMQTVVFEPGKMQRLGRGMLKDGSVPTLRANAGDNQLAVAFAQNTRDEVRYVNGDGQIAGALAAAPGMKQTTYVAQPTVIGFCGRDNGGDAAEEIAPTLRAMHDAKYDRSSGWSAAIATQMQVRRLTPAECEALQGFPRSYTAIPWRNKSAEDCPDGPRYKALGNSMAVPCMAWIGQRINYIAKHQNAA